MRIRLAINAEPPEGVLDMEDVVSTYAATVLDVDSYRHALEVILSRLDEAAELEFGEEATEGQEEESEEVEKVEEEN